MSPPLPPSRATERFEREQWRGKVRVGERRNARGDVQYCADYRLNWFNNWQAVERERFREGSYTIIKVDFPTFDAAKTAAQLKWNSKVAEHKKQTSERFGRWRKIWP